MTSIGNTIGVRAWAGFRAGTEDAESDGSIGVSIHGKQETEAQTRALRYVVEHADEMLPVVLDAVVEGYASLRQRRPRPAQVTRTSLRELVSLYGVIAMNDEHEGVAYTAYQLACSWDPSGVTVVTHRDRVVAVGGLEVLEYPVADGCRPSPPPPPLTPAKRKALGVAAKKAVRKNPKRLIESDDEISVTLACWAGFRAGGRAEPSRGDLLLVADAIGEPQQAAYRHLLDRADEVQRILLAAISAKSGQDALEDQIALQSIHIHDVSGGELAYVGYGFSSSLDREHGVGVMALGERVVEVGGADTAILAWIAERDSRGAQ